MQQNIDRVIAGGLSPEKSVVHCECRQQERPVHGALRVDGEGASVLEEGRHSGQIADAGIVDDGVKIVEMETIADGAGVDHGHQQQQQHSRAWTAARHARDLPSPARRVQPR